MTDPITIRVYGSPAPQGSKRAFAIRKGGIPTGKVAVIESSHDRVKSWRQAVIDEARKITAHMDGPLTGPLSLRMIFYVARPKGHYGSGRNAERLKPGAPAYPGKPPDLSKLARATEDALTDVGIWADDAQIVRYAELAKYYCAAPFIQPGALIEISQMEIR